MSGKTHAVVGANAVWVSHAFPTITIANQALWVLLFMGIGALAGLLADADTRNAKIHSVSKGLSRLIDPFFNHRGFTHSIFMMGIVLAVSWYYLSQFHPALPWVIAIGYASHPIIDGFNDPGVGYLSPFTNKRFRLLPKILCTNVGGFVDTVLFLGGIVGLVVFIEHNPLVGMMWQQIR